ncbi:MAG: hypothetical protein J5I98_02940 [Phaeodactylibacter sp.]|nr:hypothetical protein [Phaeodactylibacter sp.]
MDTSTIKSLIAKGTLKEAFAMGEANPQLFGESLLDEFLLLKSQFKRIEKEQRLNLRDGAVELNRVIHGYLELLSEAQAEKTGTPIPNASAILAINEAKLLYQFNQPFFQHFQGVARQIEEALKKEALSPDFPQTIRDSLSQLTQLKEQMARIAAISKSHRTNYSSPELIATAEQHIGHIQEAMRIPEIPSQYQQLKALEKAFKQSGHRRQLPIYLIVVFLLLMVAAIIITIVWMAQH